MTGDSRDADDNNTVLCAAFHVGVTGHRELPAEALPGICQAVAEALALVRETAGDLLRDRARFFASVTREPAARLRLLSSLAEGADCLCAREAIRQGYELQCPLPATPADYEKSFSGGQAAVEEFRSLLQSASSVLAIDHMQESSSLRYAAAAEILLAHSDLLIAIWNGRQTNFIAGTHATIAEAVRQDIPVLVIPSAAPQQAYLLVDRSPLDQWQAPLRAHVRRTLFPFPATQDTSAAEMGLPYPPPDRSTAGNRLNLCGWMEKVLSSFAKPAAPAAPPPPGEPPAAGERDITVGMKARSKAAWCCLRTAHAAVSRAAAVLHRNNIFYRAFLPVAALSMLLAALNITGPCQWIFYAAQTAMLLAVVWLVRNRHSAEIHRTYLEYRVLSEHGRLNAFLWNMGYADTRYTGETFMGDSVPTALWYGHLMQRAAGLPDTTVNAATMRAWLRWFREDFLLPQKKYHAKRKENHFHMHAVLQKLALACFYGGLAATVARALADCTNCPGVLQPAAILALLLPTLAAFWSSCSANMAYPVHYADSCKMMENLDTLLKAVDTLLTGEADEAHPRLHLLFGYTGIWELCRLAQAKCMEEVGDWEDSIQSRMMKLT